MANWLGPSGNLPSVENSQKAGVNLPREPAVPSRRSRIPYFPDTHSLARHGSWTAALFTTAGNGNNPNVLQLLKGWGKRDTCTPGNTAHQQRKRNHGLYSKWVELENVTLTEGNQTQKDGHHAALDLGLQAPTLQIRVHSVENYRNTKYKKGPLLGR